LIKDAICDNSNNACRLLLKLFFTVSVELIFKERIRMRLNTIDWVTFFVLVFLVLSLVMGVIRAFKEDDKIEGFHNIGWIAFILICTARFFYQGAVYDTVNAVCGRIIPMVVYGILIGADVAILIVTFIFGLRRENAAKEKFVWYEPHIDDTNR
jgi:uncharacterized membrane protein SirB2